MAAPIRSGDLRQVLTITIPKRITTRTGGQDLDYDKPASTIRVHAKKLPDRKQREQMDGRETVRALAVFDVRYDSQLLNADDGRVEWRGRIYDINGIDDVDGMERRLRLYMDRNQDRENRDRPPPF